MRSTLQCQVTAEVLEILQIFRKVRCFFAVKSQKKFSIPFLTFLSSIKHSSLKQSEYTYIQTINTPISSPSMLRDATNFGILATLLTASAQAAVLPPTTPTVTITKRALEAYQVNVTIHESCNANSTQSTLLNQGYADAMELASFSKECKCIMPSTTDS